MSELLISYIVYVMFGLYASYRYYGFGPMKDTEYLDAGDISFILFASFIGGILMFFLMLLSKDLGYEKSSFKIKNPLYNKASRRL